MLTNKEIDELAPERHIYLVLGAPYDTPDGPTRLSMADIGAMSPEAGRPYRRLIIDAVLAVYYHGDDDDWRQADVDDTSLNRFVYALGDVATEALCRDRPYLRAETAWISWTDSGRRQRVECREGGVLDEAHALFLAGVLHAFNVGVRFDSVPMEEYSDTSFGMIYAVAKYNDLGADWQFRLVREARGAVLQRHSESLYGFSVSGRGFDKFFNAPESHAAKPSSGAQDFRVEEKADGSIITVTPRSIVSGVYVSTSGTPGAGSMMGDSGASFCQGFLRFFGKHRAEDLLFDLFDRMIPGVAALGLSSLSFELVVPENANVVAYSAPRLVLLTARTHGDVEVSPDVLDEIVRDINDYRAAKGVTYGTVDRPRTYNVTSIEDATRFVSEWRGSEAEGLVCRWVEPDGSVNRVKIKAPDYVVRHAAYGGKSTITWASALYFAARGTTDDMIAVRPMFVDRLMAAQQALASTAARLDARYAEIKGIAVQKDFALAALSRPEDKPFSGLFFLARKTGQSPSKLLLAVAIDDKARVAEIIPEPAATANLAAQ
jgi:hypothetical protein